jgi:hypothetical protein
MCDVPIATSVLSPGNIRSWRINSGTSETSMSWPAGDSGDGGVPEMADLRR